MKSRMRFSFEEVQHRDGTGVDANISQFFGGTSLLILVGVILDTTKQIESHLLMKRYEGFMTKGRLRGR